jgi:hypothetical protein
MDRKLGSFYARRGVALSLLTASIEAYGHKEFREAGCKDVTAYVGYDCANRAFGGAVMGRRVWGCCRR